MAVTTKRPLSIAVIHENVPESHLPAYFNSCDCFVMPSHGEGQGGPAIQCMALGKPLIAAPFMAARDYLVTPWKVDYSLEPVHNMNWNQLLHTTNAEWARLDISSLRKHMRSAYTMWRDNRNEWETLSRKCSNFIRDNYTYEVVGPQIRERILQIRS